MAVTTTRLQELAGTARRVAESSSPGAAFIDLVMTCAELQLARDGLTELMIAEDVSSDVRALRDELHHSASVALEAAILERRVRPDISIEHIQQLVCGVEYAARIGDTANHPLMLDVMVSGLRFHDESTH